MTKRLRLVAVQVIPQFVIDDGETLVPIPPVEPVMVNSADWPNVVDLVDEGRRDLETQMLAAMESEED